MIEFSPWVILALIYGMCWAFGNQEVKEKRPVYKLEEEAWHRHLDNQLPAWLKGRRRRAEGYLRRHG
jgi:hypothetical protein